MADRNVNLQNNAAFQSPNNEGDTSATGQNTATHNGNTNGSTNCNTARSITCLSAEELVFLSSSIAIALTKNKTVKEVETMINIVNLVEDNLIGILAQRGICRNSAADGFVEIYNI